ncbi:MAG TPA: HAD family hydrolase [Thermoanaerobaculia bacterium]|nr:HAD family hydrolase [Thermoanaerobaculia bacterium]
MAPLPSRPRAVIFDLDGTLIDAYAAIHESLGVVLEAFGRPPVTRDETRRMVGHGLEVLVGKAVGKENVAEGVRLFRERYEKVGLESTRLLPGADLVTRRLFERGIRLAVASNKPARFTRPLLDALGLANRFGFVAGPDDGFPPKPAPQMVFMALATLSVPAKEAVFVGDMPIDVATARAAELPIIALPSGSATRKELEICSPDVIVENLEELLPLLLPS